MKKRSSLYGAMVLAVAGLVISTAQSVQAQVCGAAVTISNPNSTGTDASIDGVKDFTVDADQGECGANEFHWVLAANGCDITITCTKDFSNESEMCTLDNNGNDTYTVGGNFPVGMSTVNCKVTSTCGAPTAEANFTVTVQDKQNPVVTVPQNVVQETDAGQCCATVAYQASVADNCPGLGCQTCFGPTVSCNPPPGTCFPIGTTTVTCIGTDGSGNTDTKTFQVIVTDQEAPTFTEPCVDRNVVANGEVTEPTATDNCDSNVTVTCTYRDTGEPVEGPVGPGTRRIDCTACDDAGNCSQCSFLVTAVAALQVKFDHPADDNEVDNIETDADKHNKFTVGRTYIVTVKLLDERGRDVTPDVADFVTVRLDVTERDGPYDSSTFVSDIPEVSSGGDIGPFMTRRTSGTFTYYLDTTGYERGTVYNSRFFRLDVTVSYNSDPSTVVGREDASMESESK